MTAKRTCFGKTILIRDFQTVHQEPRGSSTSTERVRRRCKGVLKIYIIRFAIEPQIHIYSYFYTSMKIQFKQQTLLKFWFSVATGNELLSKKAIKMLLPFATTYLCETGFLKLSNNDDQTQF